MSKELDLINKLIDGIDYHKKQANVENSVACICRETLVRLQKALLKAQEQEKVLEIIFKKNVSIFWVRECKNVEEYNYNIPDYLQLIQEEFDLLKRWLNEKN